MSGTDYLSAWGLFRLRSAAINLNKRSGETGGGWDATPCELLTTTRACMCWTTAENVASIEVLSSNLKLPRTCQAAKVGHRVLIDS
jgi:hypothetical protein